LPLLCPWSLFLNLHAQNPHDASLPVKSSYRFPAAEEDFQTFVKRISADEPDVCKRQINLLNEGYDLSDRPDPNANLTLDTKLTSQEKKDLVAFLLTL
jgi:hypothetical protein